MGLYLSDRQLRQVGNTQRALVDVTGSLDEWRRQANAELRRLMGADRTCFLFPDSAAALCFSDDTDPSFMTLLQEAFNPNSDCPPDAYVMQSNMRRAQRRLTAWHEGMFSERGKLERTRFYNDLNVPSGARYMMGLSSYDASGEATISIAYDRPGAVLYSEDGVRLLGLVAPALSAGLFFRRQMHGASTSFFDALNLINGAALIIGPDGEELFRNVSLVGPISDNDSATILAAMRSVAQAHSPFWRNHPGEPGPAAQAVRSEHAVYRLSTTRLPQEVYGREALLVLAHPVSGDAFQPAEDMQGRRDSVPTPGLPTSEEIRRHFGLTPQEAKAALFMAEGLTSRAMSVRMFISVNTARRYSEQVLRKLDVHSRSAVALRLMECGWA